MGLFTSKIAVGLMAGSVTLGGLGLLFTGTDKLEQASQYVQETTAKITQYEANENSLLNKVTAVKSDADSKITNANAVIAGKKEVIAQKEEMIVTLESAKSTLENEVATLKSEIVALEADLAQANGDLEATRTALAEKTAQYDAKVVELNKANKTIAELNNLLVWAKNKAVEADKHVAELEGELQKANQAVDAHDAVVKQAKTDTADKAPMTQEEVDSVDTSTEDVVE